MSAIYFDARIDGAQLQKDITNINQQLNRITQSVKKEGNEMDLLANRIGLAFAGAFTAFSGVQIIKDVARVRGEFQQLEVAFETMLGNKVKADQLMAEVVEFASRTPFTLQDVATGAKQLLAYGIEAENVLPTLKSMGDVSAGLSVPIERLILNYGQVRTQLKMTGKELRDFQVAGVPIVAELAKNLGVMETDIEGMVSASKIGFDDVEKAFRTMTSQGGRFNDLMDKQAKTITGLASNFSDAWDKMLNSIGKQNEGVITDSIKAATELVNNYEGVLKVLTILAVTYGSYKAVVIAAGIAQKTAATYGVFDVATKKLQISATLKAAVAQNSLNTAMKANPIGFIIGAIGALVSILSIYGSKTDEVAGVSSKFTQNLGEEKKAIGQAFEAVKNAKNGTEDRAKAIAFVNEKYKDYLPNLLTEASNLKEVEKAQNLVTTAVAKTLAFKAQEEQLGDLKERTTGAWTDFYNAIDKSVKGLTSEQQGKIKAMMEEYARGVKEWSGMSTISSEFEKLAGKKLGAFAFNDLDSAFKAVKRSEREVIVTTKELKTEYDSYLKALGIGESVPEPTVLKTVNERIVETNNLLETAKVKLTELMTSGSTATDKDLIDQNAQIKEYEEKLVLLTGVSKQVSKALLKEQQERFEGEVDFAAQEIELQRSVEASRIAIMQEGTERQKKETEAAFQDQLDSIEKQKEEYLKIYNAKTGLKPGDNGYVTELPIEAFEQFDTLRINAEIDKNQKIEKINEDSANAIKAIWDNVNDVYLTDTQRTIKQINDHYDSLVEETIKIDPTADISKINEARGKATTEAVINSQIGILEFEEQIAMQRAEISTQGFNREFEIEKKKLGIARKTAEEKIKILSESDEVINAQEIERLKLFIEATDDGLAKLKTENILGYIDGVNSGLGMMNQLLQEQGAISEANVENLQNAQQALSALSQVASGNYIGAAFSVITMIASGFESMEVALSELFTKLREEIESIKSAIELANKTLGNIGNGNDLKSIDNTIKKLRELTAAAVDLNKKTANVNFYGEGGNWFGEMNQIMNPAKPLTEYLAEMRKEIPILVNKLLYGTLTAEQKKAIEETLNSYNSIIESIDGTINKLTGTSTNELADAMVAAFEAGEGAAVKWGETVDDIIKNIILKQLTSQFLVAPIQNALTQFADNSSDGVQVYDIQDLETALNKAFIDGKLQYEAAMKVLEGFGIDSKATVESSQQGIKGSFQSLTEETGGMIAGQFFAFRELQQKNYDTSLMMLDSINQTVGHLAEIAKNTKHNVRLEAIENGINSMNTILKERL